MTVSLLEILHIADNPSSGIGQFSSADSAVIDALRVRICEFESPTYVRPVKDRIEGRGYPSAFKPHSYIKRPDLELIEHFTRTDLSVAFHPMVPFGGLNFESSPYHEMILRENPNMIFILEIAYYEGVRFGLDEDSPYWLRNPDGTIRRVLWYRDNQGNERWETLVDITKPEVHEMIVAQAVAAANCGLYDGIFLDNWDPNPRVGISPHIPVDVQLKARDKILQGIRASVPDDFLIVVNPTWQKIPRWASYVNGIFMETWGSEDSGDRSNPHEFFDTYTHSDFQNYEEALLWNEAHLRYPNFTLVFGRFTSYANPQSPKSRQTMRAFTTLTLTHSEGYVMMDHGTHTGVLYDFWEANLGSPVGEKAQTYNGTEGFFIREFSNGWAVYNRSGSAQTITLPRSGGVASGVVGTQHVIPDLDGEIYLREKSCDVNRDGIVNILDLVRVASAFGAVENFASDVNSDGIVNILDLVLVASAM